MKCPYCGEFDSKVIDSRPTEDGEKIRRRRECLSCAKRFTTYEIVETVPLMVIKRDRSREAFDRQKLLGGMLRASEKREVSYQTLEAAVDRIEQTLLNSYEREVTSMHIGELAMDELKKIDEVAYVRFASVYRQFSDLNTFMDELKDTWEKLPWGYCNGVMRNFEQDTYTFIDMYPELHYYGTILEKYNIERSNSDLLFSTNVSDLDDSCLEAMIVAVMRSEHHNEGTLLPAIMSGAIVRWLKKLRESDKSKIAVGKC